VKGGATLGGRESGESGTTFHPENGCHPRAEPTRGQAKSTEGSTMKIGGLAGAPSLVLPVKENEVD